MPTTPARCTRTRASTRPTACRTSSGGINNALRRADQIQHMEGRSDTDYFLPIVADAEAGFGGPLNAFELMKGMIEAGAAGVHFEDQLASEKKCGHMGGKVLVPTQQFIRTLIGRSPGRRRAGRAHRARRPHRRQQRPAAHQRRRRARPAVHHRRAHARRLLPHHGRARHRDRPRAVRTPRMPICSGARPRRPIWTRPSDSPRRFTPSSRASCWPTTVRLSFNWKKKLDDATIARFQRELGAMGYKFQFVTLAGFHALNLSMFELARGYRESGMTAYAALAGARVRSSKPTRATGPRSISVSSAPATSTKSPRRSPAATPRRRPCAARPKRRSSKPNRRLRRKLTGERRGSNLDRFRTNPIKTGMVTGASGE